MTIKGILFTIIVVALGLRCMSPAFKSCTPIGYEEFRPLIQFYDAEETGLLWVYVLYTPHRPKKLTRNEKLLNTHSLIFILLINGGIESHPCECLDFFLLSTMRQFGLNEKVLIKSYMYRYFVCLRPSFMNKYYVHVTCLSFFGAIVYG